MNSILNLIRRRRMKIEVPEEIESHIQERTDELVEAGIPERQARQQATREFGNPLLYLEVSRDSWGWTWLDRLSQDLRYGVRQMSRNPTFTLLAASALALGIGANTAIFTVINSLMLRTLPVAGPARLVAFATPEFPGDWTCGPTGTSSDGARRCLHFLI